MSRASRRPPKATFRPSTCRRAIRPQNPAQRVDRQAANNLHAALDGQRASLSLSARRPQITSDGRKGPLFERRRLEICRNESSRALGAGPSQIGSQFEWFALKFERKNSIQLNRIGLWERQAAQRRQRPEARDDHFRPGRAPPAKWLPSFAFGARRAGQQSPRAKRRMRMPLAAELARERERDQERKKERYSLERRLASAWLNSANSWASSVSVPFRARLLSSASRATCCACAKWTPGELRRRRCRLPALPIISAGRSVERLGPLLGHFGGPRVLLLLFCLGWLVESKKGRLLVWESQFPQGGERTGWSESGPREAI